MLDYLDRPWQGYRKVRKGVMKRLRRHMEEIGCATIDCYIDFLERDPGAMQICQAHLRVTISRFFRDRQVWQHLEHRLLKELALRFPAGLSAWSAGCACGEETYSLAILRHRLGLTGSLQILASDAEPVCLERARHGIYQKSGLKELSTEDIESSFSRIGKDSFAIRIHYKENIVWRKHDLIEEPPAKRFHIILLRNNLLTYYREPLLDPAIGRIVQTLAPGGLFIVGAHEWLPASAVSLVRDKQCPFIYHLPSW
ncbi:CheR family methyltransferase [Desulfopila inferna]|uniref:CheR family methyltransferase n=1 Tax=Desulfopila inferna TaxID=468528 RepID=UPI0019626AE0|nr:CheR family methyltransferase [Desulfopila inferna]MBM9606597.1 hypothetical protein [Desulfopila inferna]